MMSSFPSGTRFPCRVTGRRTPPFTVNAEANPLRTHNNAPAANRAFLSSPANSSETSPKPKTRRPAMSLSSSSKDAQQTSVISEERALIPNKHGEKLVGILSKTDSKKLVILCHGFRGTKEDRSIQTLTSALTRHGISVFSFDFSGNGESEGLFEFGNYRKEADDLHAVVLYFSEKDYEITAIVGHSKGGDVVLLYASIYRDVWAVINLSGRLDLQKGLEERLGKKFMERIKKDGFIDVKDGTGEVQYRVTEASIMERLNTDMRAAALSIDNKCRVLTVHGSSDEVIPVEDAYEFAKLILNHKLHIVDGANHCYTEHQAELASIVVDYINSIRVESAAAPGDG